MTVFLTFFTLMVAGSIGAIIRWRLDLRIGILGVNTVGSGLAGAFWAAMITLSSAYDTPTWGEPLVLIGATGFLGAFTTFSTAVIDVLALLQERRGGRAVALLLGSWGLALVTCMAGILLGSWLTAAIIGS